MPAPAEEIPLSEWCFFHGRESDEGAFRVCGECGHAFMTEKELVDADLTWREPGSSPSPVEQIYSCPLCTHDF